MKERIYDNDAEHFKLQKELTLKEYKEMTSKKKKRNKYFNIKTEYKGRVFASEKEANHAYALDISKKAMFPSQRVSYWIPQVPFTFACGTKMIVDFLVLYADGRYEFQDTKGGEATKTAAYKIKKKLLKNEYSLDLKEV